MSNAFFAPDKTFVRTHLCNDVAVEVLSVRQLEMIWLRQQKRAFKKEGSDSTKSAPREIFKEVRPREKKLETFNLIKSGAELATATAISGVEAKVMLKDLKLSKRKHAFKTINGIKYMMIQRSPGAKSVFHNTFTKTEFIKIAAKPKKTIVNGLRSKNTVITITLSVSFRIVEHFIDDESTCAELFSEIGTDVAKVAIGAVVGELVAMGATAFLTTAIGTATAPVLVVAGTIAIGFVAGVWVSNKLEDLDSRYGITKSLEKALDEFLKNIDFSLHSIGNNLIAQHLRWSSFAFPVLR